MSVSRLFDVEFSVFRSALAATSPASALARLALAWLFHSRCQLCDWLLLVFDLSFERRCDAAGPVREAPLKNERAEQSSRVWRGGSCSLSRSELTSWIKQPATSVKAAFCCWFLDSRAEGNQRRRTASCSATAGLRLLGGATALLGGARAVGAEPQPFWAEPQLWGRSQARAEVLEARGPPCSCSQIQQLCRCPPQQPPAGSSDASWETCDWNDVVAPPGVTSDPRGKLLSEHLKERANTR